jgi:hypothetical protein
LVEEGFIFIIFVFFYFKRERFCFLINLIVSTNFCFQIFNKKRITSNKKKHTIIHSNKSSSLRPFFN